MRATWYVLEDGTVADPAEVAPGKSGALRHRDGRAVAMRGQVPSTRGVDPDEERAKAAGKALKPPKAKQASSASDRQMKADDGAKYKTR